MSKRSSEKRAFGWLNIRPLWASRNDILARVLDDPTNALRERWIRWLVHKGRTDNPTIGTHANCDEVTVVIVGDPGEGDCSQDVVIPPLLAIQKDADFLVVCSDVVYPAGDVNEYAEKFYAPFADWTKPIYALPGNHDWYDELEGFMFHFCGLSPPPPGWGDNPARPLLWRKPRPRKPEAEECRAGRPKRRGAFQPAPYFVIDAGPIALVCIDTGIRGEIDRAQGKWLMRASSTIAKPKVLLTGKPLIVDGSYQPGTIDSLDRTVDDIVRDPAHGYVAAIGGDIHNYQRYPSEVRGRCIEYIVAGGGGAFMHATHRIERVTLGEIDESRFTCFPLRGDSLRQYSEVVVGALRKLVRQARLFVLLSLVLLIGGNLGLGYWHVNLSTAILGNLLMTLPFVVSALVWRQVVNSGAIEAIALDAESLTVEQASSWMGERLDVTPRLGSVVDLSPGARAVAEFVAPRLPQTGGFLHAFFSEIFDFDQVPLYKQFLRLDATYETLTITCCAAVGTKEEAKGPYIEEWVEIPLTPARREMGITQ